MKPHPASDQPQENTPQAPTVLYLVRHTDVRNPNNICYGRLPRFDISKLGREQAERTASALAEVPVDAFYTSPLKRARRTARILAGRHGKVPVRVLGLLNEVRTSWQGCSYEAVKKINFDFYNNRLKETDETLDIIRRRIDNFVREVRRHHPGQTVVAVTHGDIVGLAEAVFSGRPIATESIREPNLEPGKGSLIRLTFSSDLAKYFPTSMEYYDPNGEDPAWNQGWVKLEPVSAEVGHTREEQVR
ncbi:MAG TPA: histidine phosphatase family protein [Chloroflexia bacterium]